MLRWAILLPYAVLDACALEFLTLHLTNEFGHRRVCPLLGDDIADLVLDADTMDITLFLRVVTLRPMLEATKAKETTIRLLDVPLLRSPIVVALHIRDVFVGLRREVNPEVLHILLRKMRIFKGDIPETPPDPHPMVLFRRALNRETIHEFLNKIQRDIKGVRRGCRRCAITNRTPLCDRISTSCRRSNRSIRRIPLQEFIGIVRILRLKEDILILVFLRDPNCDFIRDIPTNTHEFHQFNLLIHTHILVTGHILLPNKRVILQFLSELRRESLRLLRLLRTPKHEHSTLLNRFLVIEFRNQKPRRRPLFLKREDRLDLRENSVPENDLVFRFRDEVRNEDVNAIFRDGAPINRRHGPARKYEDFPLVGERIRVPDFHDFVTDEGEEFGHLVHRETVCKRRILGNIISHIKVNEKGCVRVPVVGSVLMLFGQSQGHPLFPDIGSDGLNKLVVVIGWNLEPPEGMGDAVVHTGMGNRGLPSAVLVLHAVFVEIVHEFLWIWSGHFLV